MRLDDARRYFKGHHAGVEPDAGFAGRVRARLDGAAATNLGWAAVRLLPASLALVLVLGWFAIRTAEAPTTIASSPEAEEIEAPTDDLLSWVLETEENGS